MGYVHLTTRQPVVMSRGGNPFWAVRRTAPASEDVDRRQLAVCGDLPIRADCRPDAEYVYPGLPKTHLACTMGLVVPRFIKRRTLCQGRALLPYSKGYSVDRSAFDAPAPRDSDSD